MPLLETPGPSWQIWVSQLWGHCSFLLSPGACMVLFVPTKGLFLQTCVSSGVSNVGIMATSFKMAYAIPRSAAPRAPAPIAVYCWAIPPQETLKHSSGSVSVGSLGPSAHKVCLSTVRFPEKHLLLLYWLCQSLWLCGSQKTVENS